MSLSNIRHISPPFRYVIPAGLAVAGVYNRYYAGKSLDESHYLPFNSCVVTNRASQVLDITFENSHYKKSLLGGQMAIFSDKDFIGWSIKNDDTVVTDNVIEVLVQYEPTNKEILKAILERLP